MRRRVCQILLLCALGAGCRTTEVDTRPRDPLLESKKPVERPTVEANSPTLLAAEPAPPPLPTMLAHQPGKEDRLRKSVQAQTVAGNRDSQVAIPAVRTVFKPETAYDHADDYSFLQGVLEKHYDGHFELRYCAPATADAKGGIFILDEDPQLQQLEDGDVVRVEGAPVPVLCGSKPAAGDLYPRYRILKVTICH